MKIREAINLSLEQLRQIHAGGSYVNEITHIEGSEKPYRVKLASGDILECKGHDSTADLDSMFNALKPPGSHYRIRQYGAFGSTIN